jgi:BON domain
MLDNALRQTIVDKLDFEPSVDAANIGVAVDNDIVTLTGHVASYAEKVAAERAVQRVNSVRAIAEKKLRFAIRSTSRRQTIKLPSERSPLRSNPVPARDFAHRDWIVIGNFWLQLEVERSEAEQVPSWQ